MKEPKSTLRPSELTISQRGRQFPLVIFRVNSQKGWGVRTLAPIAEGDFVTEYVGEVL